MVQLAQTELELLLDEVEQFVADNENIVSVEIDDGSDDRDPEILVKFKHGSDAPSFQSWQLNSQGQMLEIQVSSQAADPITLDLGRADDLKDAFATKLTSKHLGMGGTRINRADGRWGTLSFSLAGIEIMISRGGVVLQRCARTGPTLISNAHVLAPNGTGIHSNGYSLGTTLCHFNLNARDSADYGHASWDSELNTGNYFKVYDPADANGKTLKHLTKVGVGYGVGKQGAKTGWTTGYVQAKTVIRLDGHSGTFRCWRAGYLSKAGDSGSPVIYRIGTEWYLAGIHFASEGHFWSWDDIGQFAEADLEKFLKIQF